MADEVLASFKREVVGLYRRAWLRTGIALVFVLAVALVAWILAGHARFPDHFWDGFGGAILGAIVGGAMAAGGGYLATRHIRRLDVQRAEDQAERDYRAAIIVVLDELQANRGVAENVRRGPYFTNDPSSIGLSEATYLRVEHFLAYRLPEPARTAVVNAYAEIRARDTLFDPAAYQMIGGGGSTYTRAVRPRAAEMLSQSISGAILMLERERRSWPAR
jgi:hypothetical protein